MVKDPRFTETYDAKHGPILNSDVIEEFDKLFNHVDKGCLSDIPPCGTTSTNENLHRKINDFFSGEKMGPALAAALMGFLVYSWNCKRAGKDEDQCHLTEANNGAVKSVPKNIDVGIWKRDRKV